MDGETPITRVACRLIDPRQVHRALVDRPDADQPVGGSGIGRPLYARISNGISKT